jgi:hypothetical protein
MNIKIIILFVVFAILFGGGLFYAESCSRCNSVSDGLIDKVDGYTIYQKEIEGHEYIIVGNGTHYGGGVGITHKKNCKVCINKSGGK